MPSVLWFDPGIETGIQYGVFGDDYAYEMRKVWQIPCGVLGLRDWIHGGENVLYKHADFIGAEKFIPRPLEGMSHTLDSTYPLVQEGVLMEAELMPIYPAGNWQPATAQTLSGGDTEEERRHRTDDLLRSKGYWMTGSQLGRPDAKDVNSTTRHILYFLTRKLKHAPTIEALYGEEL